MAIIAPSLLAADFLNLQHACDMVNQSVGDWFHLDVMDGKFVPNISFGPMIIKFVRNTTKKICDVHLMIEAPERLVDTFKDAGADILTVHYEACPHLHRNIQQIKSLGMKAGVAINPHTPVALLKDIIADIDILLIMSVNPGFGGQKFIGHTYQKIREAKELILETGSKALIEIDGGVSLENAASLVQTGVDVLVAGNTVFSAADPVDMISKLKNA